LSDAGTKAFCLNQHCGKSLNIVEACATGQFAKCLNSAFADAHFQIHKLQLFAEFRMRNFHVLRNFQQRLIQAKSRFDANYQQVERIWKSPAKLTLTRAYSPGEPHIRQQVSKRKSDNRYKENIDTIQAGKINAR